MLLLHCLLFTSRASKGFKLIHCKLCFTMGLKCRLVLLNHCKRSHIGVDFGTFLASYDDNDLADEVPLDKESLRFLSCSSCPKLAPKFPGIWELYQHRREKHASSETMPNLLGKLATEMGAEKCSGCQQAVFPKFMQLHQPQCSGTCESIFNILVVACRDGFEPEDCGLGSGRVFQCELRVGSGH